MLVLRVLRDHEGVFGPEVLAVFVCVKRTRHSAPWEALGSHHRQPQQHYCPGVCLTLAQPPLSDEVAKVSSLSPPGWGRDCFLIRYLHMSRRHSSCLPSSTESLLLHRPHQRHAISSNVPSIRHPPIARHPHHFTAPFLSLSAWQGEWEGGGTLSTPAVLLLLLQCTRHQEVAGPVGCVERL